MTPPPRYSWDAGELDALMRKRGWSVQYVAMLTYSSETSVRAWLAGTEPRGSSLVAICDHADVRLRSLYRKRAPTEVTA